MAVTGAATPIFTLARSFAPGDLRCAAWRQTADCKADGAREPEHDAGCDASIAWKQSGHCECVSLSGAPAARVVVSAVGCDATKVSFFLSHCIVKILH